MLDLYLVITIRTIVLYGVIMLIFRFMGKREVGELSLLDLVVFMMMAEVAVFAIEDPYMRMLDAVYPMFLLMLLQIFLSYLSLKSKSFRDVVDGTPSVLVRDGRLIEKEMKRNRYNIDDLIQQLREKDVFDMADVKFAILEPSGTLTVLKKNDGSKLSLPLVMDGKIQYDHLHLLNHDEHWLRDELSKKGHDIKRIFFCSYEAGQWYVSLKD